MNTDIRKIEIKFISPETAKALLDDPDRPINRSVTKGTVKSYAKDMRMGNWPATISPIWLHRDTGKLLDGQHRLAAIVYNWAGCYLSVTYGTESDLKYIDSGRGRTFANRLVISGEELDHKIAKATSSIVTGLALLEDPTGPKINASLFNQAKNIFGEENIRYIASFYYKQGMTAAAATALTMCRPLNPQIIDNIINDCIITAQPTVGTATAINRLRARLNNNRKSNRDRILYYIRSIRHMIEGTLDLDSINFSKLINNEYTWAKDQRKKIGLENKLF